MLCERPSCATMATAIQRINGDAARASKYLPRGLQRLVLVPPGQILDPIKPCPADFRACDRRLVLHLQPRKLDTHSLLNCAQPFPDTLQARRPAPSSDPKRDERRAGCGLWLSADQSGRTTTQPACPRKLPAAVPGADLVIQKEEPDSVVRNVGRRWKRIRRQQFVPASHLVI